MTDDNEIAQRRSTNQTHLARAPPIIIESFGGDLKAADASHTLTKEWRKACFINDIVNEKQPYFALIKQKYVSFFHGFTKGGNVGMWHCPGKSNLPALWRSGIAPEDVVRHFIFLIEYALDHLDRSLNNSMKVVTIFDLQGMKLSDLVGPFLVTLKQAIAVFQEHYVGRNDGIYLLNTPQWFVKTCERMVYSNVLNNDNKAKVFVLKEPKDLFDVMPRDQVPMCYGGVDSTLFGASEIEKHLLAFVQNQSKFDLNQSGTQTHTHAYTHATRGSGGSLHHRSSKNTARDSLASVDETKPFNHNNPTAMQTRYCASTLTSPRSSSSSSSAFVSLSCTLCECMNIRIRVSLRAHAFSDAHLPSSINSPFTGFSYMSTQSAAVSDDLVGDLKVRVRALPSIAPLSPANDADPGHPHSQTTSSEDVRGVSVTSHMGTGSLWEVMRCCVSVYECTLTMTSMDAVIEQEGPYTHAHTHLYGYLDSTAGGSCCLNPCTCMWQHMVYLRTARACARHTRQAVSTRTTAVR